LVPMGEKFRGFEGNWVLCLVLFLSICLSSLHPCVLLCMVEYIVETPPTTMVGNVGNEIQVHSHMHRLWGSFSIYDGSTNITYFCSI
jgi:hypothetical protein